MAPPTDAPDDGPVLFLAIIRLESADLANFERYERIVLPLACEHGATVERTLRSLDVRLKVHLLALPSRASLEAFRVAGPRVDAQDLLIRSGAQVSVHDVRAVSYLQGS